MRAHHAYVCACVCVCAHVCMRACLCTSKVYISFIHVSWNIVAVTTCGILWKFLLTVYCASSLSMTFPKGSFLGFWLQLLCLVKQNKDLKHVRGNIHHVTFWAWVTSLMLSFSSSMCLLYISPFPIFNSRIKFRCVYGPYFPYPSFYWMTSLLIPFPSLWWLGQPWAWTCRRM